MKTLEGVTFTDEERMLLLAILARFTREGPAADAENLPFFTRAHALDCCREALSHVASEHTAALLALMKKIRGSDDSARLSNTPRSLCSTLKGVKVTFIMQVGNGAPTEMIEAGIRKMLREKGMSDATLKSVSAEEITG